MKKEIIIAKVLQASPYHWTFPLAPTVLWSPALSELVHLSTAVHPYWRLTVHVTSRAVVPLIWTFY